MSSSDSDVSLSTYSPKKCASLNKSSSSQRASSSDLDMLLPTSNSKKCVSMDDILDNMTATGRRKKTKVVNIQFKYCSMSSQCSDDLSSLKHLLKVFDEDVNLGMEHLQDRTWPLLSTNWLLFLYAANAIYDRENPNIGLFCGHAGIREHDDDDGKHGRSKSKATMYGLTKVTLQAWAWAMCAVWFSLSTCNSYKMCIGSFNLEEFFFTIIKTLNDPEDP
ncbi:uncharacterized protein BJ212DRAFT_1296749 [Suillus subaureus]|uniref:Uncharacterized protein n=1 Tax=Suillus subaureus TaxID=48587 RepID=A0A9P7EIE6_9AGAM|nr:uncharacterized protein BJ212DRAFT_1296749 [Suillus subaureus]KAG1822787.1 hypothetical protein BJ212DRAFT_1296749 [Suillus subaureus]